MTKELSVSRKYLTNHPRTELGIVAWPMSGITSKQMKKREGGGVYTILTEGDGEMETQWEAYMQLTSLNVVPFCDRARELWGFISVIPEE